MLKNKKKGQLNADQKALRPSTTLIAHDMTETTVALGTAIATACTELDINHLDSILSFSRIIDKISPELAKSEQVR